jgi:hypothetical protein
MTKKIKPSPASMATINSITITGIFTVRPFLSNEQFPF